MKHAKRAGTPARKAERGMAGVAQSLQQKENRAKREKDTQAASKTNTQKPNHIPDLKQSKPKILAPHYGCPSMAQKKHVRY